LNVLPSNHQYIHTYIYICIFIHIYINIYTCISITFRIISVVESNNTHNWSLVQLFLLAVCESQCLQTSWFQLPSFPVLPSIWNPLWTSCNLMPCLLNLIKDHLLKKFHNVLKSVVLVMGIIIHVCVCLCLGVWKVSSTSCIPVLEFFTDIIVPAPHWPWGRLSVGMTNLTPSCADFLNVWETQNPGTLRDYRGCNGISLPLPLLLTLISACIFPLLQVTLVVLSSNLFVFKIVYVSSSFTDIAKSINIYFLFYLWIRYPPYLKESSVVLHLLVPYGYNKFMISLYWFLYIFKVVFVIKLYLSSLRILKCR
jgi:hypothetical protein